MYKNSDLLYSKIKEDNIFWKQVIESLEDYALFVISKEGQISSWNVGGENLFYYTNDEIIGQQGDILFTPEDRDAGVPALEMEVALEKGKAIDERFHARRDGSRFWASGLVFPLHDSKGQHIGFTKIMRDLHERKEAENQLLAAKRYAEGVIETATSPMVVLNDDLTINTANNAFYSYYNVPRDKERRAFLEINNRQWDKESLRDLLEELRLGKDSERNHQFSYSFVHLGRRVLEFTIRKLHPENINKGLILIAIEDVTAKKALDKEKEDFIGIASHELRTPVSSIKAFLQILQRKAADVKDVSFQEHLKRTLELSEKLSVLITTLLDVSRLRTGKLILKNFRFNLWDLISETILHMQLIYPSHHILVDGDRSVEVYGDRVWVEQTLTNLITNGIKFSPDADKIIINCSKDTKSSCAVVSVKDFGIGIPVSEQDKIFRRFARTNKVMEKQIPGLGIGLHLCYEVVKIQRGSMWFESVENEGSVFYFSLPTSN